jgi:zinc transport system ATP-binding protein
MYTGGVPSPPEISGGRRGSLPVVREEEFVDRKVIVEAKNLELGYGRRVVLRDVNLEIREGEFWFFVGPNGEGKSTLLKAILGSLSPRRGALNLDPQFACPERIGFVPQRCDLNPTLPTTVREFVLLGLVNLSVPRAEYADRLEWALQKVQMSGLADKDYWALSGGQRQRALVARALVRRPGFLIVDEPTNGLDLAAESALLRSVAKLHRDDGLTVLFVTHDLTIVARHATHVALFREQHVKSGTGDDVLIPAELEKTYGVAVSLVQDDGGGVGIRLADGEACL